MRTAHTSRNASRQVAPDGTQIIALSREAFKSVRVACVHGAGALQDHEGLDNEISLEALSCFGIIEAWPGSDDVLGKFLERQHGAKYPEGIMISLDEAERDEFIERVRNETSFTISVVEGMLCVDGQYLTKDDQGRVAWVESPSEVMEKA